MEAEEGTALGAVGDTRSETIELHRGDMLLMLSTCGHHGMRALEGTTRA